VIGRYAGKVAVVTGGASGIGEAIVRRLLAEGASVVAGDVNAERLAALGEELGDRFAATRADVRLEAEVEALVATAGDRFGGLDAAFNAACTGGGGLIANLEEEDWRWTLDVCLTGVLLAMKHEARALVARGGGAIVNIASIHSQVPLASGSAYCAAKAGVAMLSKCGALELAEQNVRVNTVSPGLTDTPMTAGILSIPGVREAYLERIPVRRAATPEEIAAACLYLASDDAAYVTGAELFVDGGWTLSNFPDLRPYLGEELRL
jgi:NAD(P)-dependent dehydrogenase (short-subunit alcohol dehydrogenase family)